MQFTDKLEKLPQQTFKIEVTIPWQEIDQAKTKAVATLAKSAEVKGFRKGKAPLNLVKEHLGEQAILEEASKEVLTAIYGELIKKHDLKPFLDPKISLLKAPQGSEWVFRFEIAQAPLITKMPDYRKVAKEASSDLKKEDIWVPGKDKEKPEAKDLKEKQNKKIQLIFDKLMKEAQIEISALILDTEVNRRLTAIYDEVKQLGLSVEQYLESKKLTAQALRDKTQAEIKDLYKSEFLLEKIADQEKIVVDDKDLEAIYKQAKDEKEKALYQQNSYLYVRLLRKQKTLDFLAGL